MSNLLLSWMSDYTDFEKTDTDRIEINTNGPTFDLHKNFFANHTKHIILSTAHQEDPRLILLKRDLSRTFKNRQIEIRGLDIVDPDDYRRVWSKVESVFDDLTNETEQIDVLLTTGTTTMRMVLMLLHLSHHAPTRLIQGKDPRRTGTTGQFSELHLEKDPTLSRLYLRLGEPMYPEEGVYIGEQLAPVYQQADKIAQMDRVSCLILGESGTGKEYLAKYIHENSARSHRPFIPVNCAAINDEMLQSELFGHIKGSYSDAIADRKGRFEAAKGGTIFLDEIGDISKRMQQSLLRVLQEKEFVRLGENKPIKTNVRMLAATNRDLDKLVNDGDFREDLYYRLTAVELYLPSLKEYSISDKNQLIQSLLEKKSKTYKRSLLRLEKEVIEVLLAHDFPGNIRELENIITHFCVFAGETVTLDDLPPRWKRKRLSTSLLLEDAEAAHIWKVLQIFDGNLTHTRKALGIAHNTLKSKMDKHKIFLPEKTNKRGANAPR